MLFDVHTHTTSSHDGKSTPFEMCEAAIEKGIKVLAFTEHWDAFETYISGMLDDDGRCVAFRENELHDSFFEAKERYGDRLTLLYGIEFGEPSLKPTEAKELVARQKFDMIMGSVHVLDGDMDIIPYAASGASAEEIMDKYLDREIAMAKMCIADSLSHLDYPLRYVKVAPGEKLSLLPYRERVRELLRITAQNGMALEINGAGLVKATKCVGPEKWVIEDYLSFGGQYITFGSDAHLAQDLLRGYKESMALAREAGVKYAVYFKERRPHPFRID